RLPRSERELCATHGQRLRGPGERGADVRRHVVRPLFLVLVVGAFGREPRQERFQIPPHGRVGVLLDDQRGAGVLYTNVAESGPDTGGVHDAAAASVTSWRPRPPGSTRTASWCIFKLAPISESV